MRLLVDDTLVTAPFVAPMTAGWLTAAAEVEAEARPGLRAADVGAEDVALVPAAELALLQATHRVVPDVAVVADGGGAVVMRTPVRPDAIERSPVRLIDASGTAELLARATLQPFYGIPVSEWVRGDEAGATAAQAVVVEGAEALRPVEGGYAEDLVRAWFILTGLPFVSHVLVVPAAADRAALAPALATIETLRRAGHERRREWRAALVEREGLASDRLGALFAALRFSLSPDDVRAVAALVSRGARGSAYPPLGLVPLLDADLRSEGGSTRS